MGSPGGDLALASFGDHEPELVRAGADLVHRGGGLAPWQDNGRGSDAVWQKGEGGSAAIDGSFARRTEGCSAAHFDLFTDHIVDRAAILL